MAVLFRYLLGFIRGFEGSPFVNLKISKKKIYVPLKNDV